MKHTILSLLLLLSTSSPLQKAYAQNNPFVEEGKEWFALKGNGLWGIRVYTMSGDTVMAGYTWKKVTWYDYDKDDQRVIWSGIQGYYREEDGVVYMTSQTNEVLKSPDAHDRKSYYLVNEDGAGIPFISMNVEVGDTLDVFDTMLYQLPEHISQCVIKSVGLEDYLGTSRKVVQVTYRDRDYFTWVEGIGSFGMYPFDNDEPGLMGDIAYLVLCRVGDKVEYINEEWYKGIEDFLASVDSPTIKQTKSNITFDLQGRRLREEPQHGVFFQAGKKFIK